MSNKDKTDNFGNRMKSYESFGNNILNDYDPVIIRLDGNSFSKLKDKYPLVKPYDSRFQTAMWNAATAVLEYCSYSKIAYIQSDEITILLNRTDYNQGAFLNNRKDKICSLAVGDCNTVFNDTLSDLLGMKVREKFDCRVFNVPKFDVNNAFLWRQLDCFKNFVSSIVYFKLMDKYGQKKAFNMVAGLSTNQRQELFFQEFGENINDYTV